MKKTPFCYTYFVTLIWRYAMKKISLVVPCYNEQEVINLFYAEIQKVKKDFENVEF